MTAAAEPIRTGYFAVLGGVTYKVNFSLRDSTMTVLLDANDSSGKWMPDISPRPAFEVIPLSDASRLFGVRTFARWREVGVRVIEADHRVGTATAFYVPSDLERRGPRDWPSPRRSSMPPHDGMCALHAQGSGVEDQFAGVVPFDQLTDVRQTEIDLALDRDGDLAMRPSLLV